MNTFALRTDIEKIDTEQLFQQIKERASAYCYCYEGSATNPHIHWYLETKDKAPALRAMLRKLGLKGNGSYSLKESQHQPIEYLAYMLKENRFHNEGIPEEIITEAIEHQERVVAEMKAKKEAKKGKYQKVKEYVLATTAPSGPSGPRHIFKLVSRYFLDHEEQINPVIIVRYTDTIYYSLFPQDQAIEMMTTRFYNTPKGCEAIPPTELIPDDPL